MNEPIPDHELLEHYRDADSQAAFRTLVERYMPMVEGVCCRVLHDQRDVQDATQAVFVVLALKAKGLRARHGIATWLYKVARTVSIDVLRKNQRHAFKDGAAGDALPDHAVAHHDLQDIDAAIQRLPERLRNAVLQHYFLGRSLEEIAKTESITSSAVAMRLNRARDVLRRSLGSTNSVGALLLLCRPDVSASEAVVGQVVRTVQAAVLGKATAQSSAVVHVAVQLIRKWMWQRAAIACSILLTTGVVVIPILSSHEANAESPVQVRAPVAAIAATPKAPKLLTVQRVHELTAPTESAPAKAYKVAITAIGNTTLSADKLQGRVEAIKVLSFPVEFDPPQTAANNTSVITPTTPTAFETVNTGWTVSLSAKPHGKLVAVYGVADYVEATLVRGGYGAIAGPVYTVSGEVLTTNALDQPKLQTTTTRFHIFAVPGESYDVTLYRGSKTEKHSITVTQE